MNELSQTQLTNISGGTLTADEACAASVAFLIGSLYTGVGGLFGLAAVALTCTTPGHQPA